VPGANGGPLPERARQLDHFLYTSQKALGHDRIVGDRFRTHLENGAVGMVSEGFEMNYAHVKLIPIHSREFDGQLLESIPTIEMAPYEERYRGYVAPLNGLLF